MCLKTDVEVRDVDLKKAGPLPHRTWDLRTPGNGLEQGAARRILLGQALRESWFFSASKL